MVRFDEPLPISEELYDVLKEKIKQVPHFIIDPERELFSLKDIIKGLLLVVSLVLCAQIGEYYSSNYTYKYLLLLLFAVAFVIIPYIILIAIVIGIFMSIKNGGLYTFESVCYYRKMKKAILITNCYMEYRNLFHNNCAIKKHYETLGISNGASISEIESAYKKAILSLSPFINKSMNTGEQVSKVEEAYKVLGSKESREYYDFNLADFMENDNRIEDEYDEETKSLFIEGDDYIKANSKLSVFSREDLTYLALYPFRWIALWHDKRQYS